MSANFNHTVGGLTLYTNSEVPNVRFCLAHYGEDTAKVIEHFWKERPAAGNFVVVPVFAHGLPPRMGFCTKESLEAALHPLPFDPNDSIGVQWMQMLRHFGISINALAPWPKAEVIPLEKTKRKRS
jgi:hypothetical protein